MKDGSKVRVRVGDEMQLKTLGNQRRVNLVAQGVWAMEFFSDEDYRGFVGRFHDCLSENNYGVESTGGHKYLSSLHR